MPGSIAPLSRKIALFFALIAAGTTGCVFESTYRDALTESQRLRKSLEDAELKGQRAEKRAQENNEQSVRLQASLLERETALSDLLAHSSNLQSHLQDSSTTQQTLRLELARITRHAERLVAENRALAQSLEQFQAEQSSRTAAATRAQALFTQWQMPFKKRIDARELRMELKNDCVLLTLPGDMLFARGTARLKPRGQAVMKELAQKLRMLPDHALRVAGHTDGVPIRSRRFSSNWALSAERAVQVVTFLVARGVNPEMLVALAFGEFAPVAPNVSAQDKAMNRRVEIRVIPPGGDPTAWQPVARHPGTPGAAPAGGSAGCETACPESS